MEARNRVGLMLGKDMLENKPIEIIASIGNGFQQEFKALFDWYEEATPSQRREFRKWLDRGAKYGPDPGVDRR